MYLDHNNRAMEPTNEKLGIMAYSTYSCSRNLHYFVHGTAEILWIHLNKQKQQQMPIYNITNNRRRQNKIQVIYSHILAKKDGKFETPIVAPAKSCSMRSPFL